MSESNDPNDKENVKVASWLTTDKTIKPKMIEPPPIPTIAFWQTFIHEWAERKGWNQGLEERSFGDWMALLHSEISEAYEDHRNHRQVTEVYWEGDNPATAKPCGIPIELADLAIRLFHLCEFFKIDLNQMIALKMAYNETRPFRHGGKKV